MRRFWVDKSGINGQTVELSGDEFHHLRNVARLDEGEKVELLPGDGRLFTGVIESLEKRRALIKIIDTQTLPPLPSPQIEIVLCVPRFQKLDLILQKCVELGAARIIPVVSEKSFMKTLNKELTEKIPRWNKIALEACKQSGRVWPLEIAEASTLDAEIVRKLDKTTSLFLYEGESALGLREALSSIRGEMSSLKTVRCFIGAEGGFSPREVELFRASNLKPITMGSLVLRVETACIALLSILQYELDHMR